MEKINSTLLEFMAVSSEIDKAYHKAAVKLGLSDTKIYILYFLSQKKYSQKQICDLCGISKQTVNSAIKNLIAEDIVCPLRGEKNEIITLTSKGEKLIDEKISLLIRAENNAIAQWSEEDRTRIVSLNKNFLSAFLKEIEKF
ncbi:MAG: MarR family transcriptional regulator [Succinivibrio sp.]|nr:MarR family transcriptional regulator [Succinivibrio sp.]